MNNLIAILAFLVFVGFLAILLIHVPRLDLVVVIGATVALAGWDLFQNLKGNRG
ncbi:hypothetical protein [Aliigemmobacter aestuarii]|uniref:hypothetical protein n=1 Tax=Aliigemmobacter aestuarii TaxID=1445661 RepID=UPI001454BCF4|nr:hypothetical protein [Gemmobacter aestuarii]